MAEDIVPVSAPDRDIVAHYKADTTAFNSPNSLRGAVRALKKHLKNAPKQG